MRVFKISAVMFVLLFMAAFSAQAQVEVSADGKGQALIYGYYNVNDAELDALNYLRIVNTSPNRGIGVIIALRSAVDSRECLDFYVCLSPQDEWKAWILPKLNDAGQVTGVRVVGADHFAGPVVSTEYTPTYPDVVNGLIPAEGFGADCTEGYITAISAVAWEELPTTLPKRVATPEACREYVTGAADLYPGNALIGDMHLMEADIWDSLYAYNATALRDFRDPTQGPLHNPNPGINFPDLDQADGGISAVNLALSKEIAYVMHSEVFRSDGLFLPQVPYVGNTDFIVLFPTKSLSDFAGQNINFKARKWDNNEHTEVSLEFFSPDPAIPQDPFIYELNYVSIGLDRLFTLMPTNVYWGNIDTALMDQNLLNEIRRIFGPAGLNQSDVLAAIDSVIPKYEQGYLEIEFRDDTGDLILPRPAIVLKFEAISPVADTRVWTHALEAQYKLPLSNQP